MPNSTPPLVVTLDAPPSWAAAFASAVAPATVVAASSASVEMPLLARAAVVVARSLVELPGRTAQALRGAAAVLLVASRDAAADSEAAAALKVATLRLLPPDEDEEAAAERADTTLALLLSLLRKTHAGAASLHRGHTGKQQLAALQPRRCAGLRLALLGADAAAPGVARRAAACGLLVSFFPAATDSAAAAQACVAAGAVRAPSLAALLARADALSMHCGPLSSGAPALGEAEVAALPRGCVVVHAVQHARAAAQEVLARALASGALGGLAVDCVDAEAFQEEALRNQPLLLLTPHCARCPLPPFAPAALAGLAARELLPLPKPHSPKRTPSPSSPATAPLPLPFD